WLIKRNIYSSDLIDKEWILLSDLMPVNKSGAKPTAIKPREILNAIFYLLRAGCAWLLKAKIHAADILDN
ncbi:MAG: transposase, partial [Acidobacteriota bacterium]|nr:transposase [Acidobacteriota bacterium]